MPKTRFDHRLLRGGGARPSGGASAALHGINVSKSKRWDRPEQPEKESPWVAEGQY